MAIIIALLLSMGIVSSADEVTSEMVEQYEVEFNVSNNDLETM